MNQHFTIPSLSSLILLSSTTNNNNNNNNNNDDTTCCDNNDQSASSSSSSSCKDEKVNPINNVNNIGQNQQKQLQKPDILKPFLPATDPNYMNIGPVGENDFIVSREGGPTADELTNENILKIVKIQCTDLEVNTLVWKCFGYRFRDGKWYDDECFPNWKEKYPMTPPDFIGMQRVYEPEIDKVSLKANQALVRSIPVEFKQSLKEQLKPYGWKGYQYSELTPNKTRRAQCANWLLYYRTELFGYTIEQLRERRRIKKEQQEEEIRKQQQQQQRNDNQEEWKPPVREVY